MCWKQNLGCFAIVIRHCCVAVEDRKRGRDRLCWCTASAGKQVFMLDWRSWMTSPLPHVFFVRFAHTHTPAPTHASIQERWLHFYIRQNDLICVSYLLLKHNLWLFSFITGFYERALTTHSTDNVLLLEFWWSSSLLKISEIRLIDKTPPQSTI